MSEFIVSARKYRPQTFDTVIGQAAITSTLKNSIVRKHLAHAYLFCGPRGVGKTTCARIFARTINCFAPTPELEACGECESCRSFAEGRSYNIRELDAASNNSVEDIRQLTEQVRIPPQIGQYSVYIIDEVHMLSTSAFNAFLKTLEEPPAHAVFILATTEKHKILPTILSRCQVYDFSRIRVEDTIGFLKKIAAKENVTADERSLHVIAVKADGAMRDALSIFDQVVSFCGDNLAYEQVIETLNVLDYEYYFRTTAAFLAHDYPAALLLFNDIVLKGFDPLHFVAGLSAHLRNLLVCKYPQTAALMEASEGVRRQYVEQAMQAETPFIFAALNLAERCAAAYKFSSQPRFLVELCLLNISAIGTGMNAVAAAAAPVAAAPAARSVAAPAPAAAAAPTPPPAISIRNAMNAARPAPAMPAATPQASPAPTPHPTATPANSTSTKPASPQEAFQRMADQNPTLLTLQDKLGLEM